MESHWHRALFLAAGKHLLSIGELQVRWKCIVNHVRNSKNTCSHKEKKNGQMNSQLSQLWQWGQCLTARAVRWLQKKWQEFLHFLIVSIGPPLRRASFTAFSSFLAAAFGTFFLTTTGSQSCDTGPPIPAMPLLFSSLLLFSLLFSSLASFERWKLNRSELNSTNKIFSKNICGGVRNSSSLSLAIGDSPPPTLPLSLSLSCALASCDDDDNLSLSCARLLGF